MKLLFSEHKADYAHYIFPYAIWAFPEPDEKPSDLFNLGFLPSSCNLDRFYLCRQVRIDLARFQPSSENRRILRKGTGIEARLTPRAEFDYTPARRHSYQACAEARFGRNVMPAERIDALLASRIVSHLLLFTDTRTGADAGAVMLHLEEKELAYYYYAFYDLNSPVQNLGMFMMTTAAGLFARKEFRHLYLGTCYSRNALYKTQFTGAEFFNGCRWSNNLAELKYLIERDQSDTGRHLLETEEYQRLFAAHPEELAQSPETLQFRIKRQNPTE